MPNVVSTKYTIMDIKTGRHYGLVLDAEGKCRGLRSFSTEVLNPDDLENDTVFEYSAPHGRDYPFGATLYAVEVGNPKALMTTVFTIAIPTEKDAKAGAVPVVAKKELPSDLVKAGIAPALEKAQNTGVSDDEALKLALKNIDNMIGLTRAKNDIKQNIALARFNRAKEELGLNSNPISRHMVFTGNPGTGKTTFAREVAKVLHALGFIKKPAVHEVKREDLVAGYVGQTAIKTKEQITKALGGVLFIDEAYSLFRGGNGNDNDFGREAIDTLVAEMENHRDDLVVIVAGYTDRMKTFLDANEGLKSRFMTYIGFDDYSMEDLGKILDFMTKQRGYSMDAPVRALAMDLIQQEKGRVRQQDFANGRVVRNLVEKVEKEIALRLENEGKLQKDAGLSKEELKTLLTTITLADMEKVDLSSLVAQKNPEKIVFGKDKNGKGKEAFNDNSKKPSNETGKPVEAKTKTGSRLVS